MCVCVRACLCVCSLSTYAPDTMLMPGLGVKV